MPRTMTMYVEEELLREYDRLLGEKYSDVRKSLRHEAGRNNAGRAALIRRALRLALKHKEELLTFDDK